MNGAADSARATRLWVLLGLIAACYYAIFAFYPALFWLVGVNHYGVWFLDSFAILASNDAVTRGLNPYLPNPLDYFHRPHVYSHWWLYLHYLGLKRADNLWVGLTLVSAFLAAAISRLRPREPRQFFYYLAVLGSPGILLAINRANNDLVVFVVLAAVVPCVLSRQPAVRAFAAVFVAFAAGLKYYPAAAALVLLAGGGSRPERRYRIALVLGLLLLVAIDVGGDLTHFDQPIAKAEGFMSFSASTSFEALGLGAGVATVCGAMLGAVIFGWAWRARPFEGWRAGPAREADWLHFVLGSALLVGCFFTGTNFAYRWVFALWLLPILWWLPRDAEAPARVRSVARVTRVLLLLVLWIDAVFCTALLNSLGHAAPAAIIRLAGIAFQIEQPLVWAFFGCLLGFLAHFVRSAWRDFATARVSEAAAGPAPARWPR